MSGCSPDNKFLLGVVCGGLIGTLSALLFTTKQGRKIQNKIVDAYEDIEDTVKSGFSQGKEKLQSAKEKVQDSAEHAEKKVAQKFKEGQKDFS